METAATSGEEIPTHISHHFILCESHFFMIMKVNRLPKQLLVQIVCKSENVN